MKVISIENDDCVFQGSAQETGRISTPRLNASRHFHLEPINLVIFQGPHNDYLSWSTFPAYMLSAVIVTRHSYPAVPLARQLVDQRSVHPGPLVDASPISRSSDYIFTLPEGEGGGILPAGAVVFFETIPLPASPRVFQRKSVRGQTEYSIQFFFRLTFPAHIVLILYEQEQIDDFAHVA